MPVAQLDNFREDVREFLEAYSELQMKIAVEYAMKNAPELAKIMPKITANNAKYFSGEATIEDLWNVMSMDEMVAMAGGLRYVTEKVMAAPLEQNPLSPDIQVEAVDIDGVPAEWQIVPEAAADRVLLYFHGGGWVLMSPLTHRLFTIALGQATKMRVLSVDYRLAPEYPFPAAFEDCMKAYQWLLDQGIQPGNIVIAGDSAGGNLTLATILNLRDKGMPLPRGAACFSPCTSFVPSDMDLEKGKTDPILGDAGVFWWLIAYLGQEHPADIYNPYISPLLGDLQGFPPVLIQSSTPELLYEQCQKFIEKAKEAGVDATLQAWDGLFHVWQGFALGVLPEAQEAIDKAGEWIQNLFA
ncbi:MAG TPA: alpha/beta hydrolase [Candidatus Lokiarchaeia archaeon]|nr:alpha/beta hydrolase [Candidatus Lokiarchaeia archaeon]